MPKSQLRFRNEIDLDAVAMMFDIETMFFCASLTPTISNDQRQWWIKEQVLFLQKLSLKHPNDWADVWVAFFVHCWSSHVAWFFLQKCSYSSYTHSVQHYLMDMLEQLIADVNAKDSNRIDTLTKRIALRGRIYVQAFGRKEYLKNECKLLITETNVMMDRSHVTTAAYVSFTTFLNSLRKQEPKWTIRKFKIYEVRLTNHPINWHLFIDRITLNHFDGLVDFLFENWEDVQMVGKRLNRLQGRLQFYRKDRQEIA